MHNLQFVTVNRTDEITHTVLSAAEKMCKYFAYIYLKVFCFLFELKCNKIII